MGTILAILLVAIGAISTLAAFGGKTWREGSESFWERVTARGWVSLICLLLSLSCGVLKEVVSSRKDADKAAQQKEEKLIDEGRHTAELAAANAATKAAEARENLADQRLQDLQMLTEQMQARLSETKQTLGNVRGDLVSTRDQLKQQNAATIITGFANSEQKVREAYLFVPLTKAVRPGRSTRQTFLPQFTDQACSDLAGLDIVTPFTDGKNDIYFDPGDAAREHEKHQENVQSVDELFTIKELLRANPDMQNVVSFLDQRSSNGEMFFAAFRDPRKLLTAARLYAGVTSADGTGVSIYSDWPTVFRNKHAYELAKAKYPTILTNNAPAGEAEDLNIAADKAKPMPKRCIAELEQNFRASVEKALLIVFLDQKESEVIIFHLKAEQPKFDGDLVYLRLVPDSTPLFTTASPMSELDRGSAWLWQNMPAAEKP